VKAITILQPWVHAVFHCGKTVENRSWVTEHRGLLLIHAGKSRRFARLTAYPDGTAVPPFDSLPLGAIVGQVKLIDCVPAWKLRRNPWTSGPICWVMSNPRVLAEPIPCAGQLRLWTPPDSVLAAIGR
jgi:hypothetical protein